MNKKYLIAILIIAIVAFAGVEIFRKTETEEPKNNTSNTVNTENTSNEINTNTPNNISEPEDNTTNTTNTTNTLNSDPKVEPTPTEKITNGEDLIAKAKTLTARGWAGASNNVIGLKDGILYYYNKSSGEFYEIAEGIEDIYFKTEYAEDITAKKGTDFKEVKERPLFVEYE